MYDNSGKVRRSAPPLPQRVPGQADYPPFRPEAFNMAPNQTLGLATATPHRKARRWPWALAGLVLIFLGVVAIAAAAGPTVPPASATVVVSHAAVTPKRARPAPGTVGDGTYAVGSEIAPGQYVTTAPTGGLAMGCTWERLKDDTGDLADIIAAGVVEAGGHGRVRVAQSDRFVEFVGGCTWKLG